MASVTRATWACSAAAPKIFPVATLPTADAELSQGLNRFVVHTSVHQPLDYKKPGLGLGPFGQWFTRHETWAEQAKVSPGCANCYAEALNQRFGGPPYKRGADTLRLDEKILTQPLRWKKPRRPGLRSNSPSRLARTRKRRLGLAAAAISQRQRCVLG